MLKIQDKNAVIKRTLIDFLIFALLLASDLISKDVVMNRLGLTSYSSYTLVDGLFAIYPCFNDGASFSVFSGKTGFLIALTVILMICLAVIAILNSLKRPKTSWLFRWSMLLLIAGGLGNLVDRVFCEGRVRDFIQYLFLDKLFEKLFNTSFGVGNVADIYLVLGVFLICAYIVFDYKEGDLGIWKSKKVEKVKVAENSNDNDIQSDKVENEETCNPVENQEDIKQDKEQNQEESAEQDKENL
ncbi:MAG: signal peptidase II [Clostridia bacterium]|nr:signal peptidase II [Clostridia bacterium]MDE6471404.1 signal peptidase II [Clostridia bacterium]